MVSFIASRNAMFSEARNDAVLPLRRASSLSTAPRASSMPQVASTWLVRDLLVGMPALSLRQVAVGRTVRRVARWPVVRLPDRKSVVLGKSVAVRVDRGGRGY